MAKEIRETAERLDRFKKADGWAQRRVEEGFAANAIARERLVIGKIGTYQNIDNSRVPEELWRAGDIVTRDGNDEHEIIELNEPRDLISVVCVKEPPIYEGSDEPWTKLGETEDNLTRRYDFVRPGKTLI